MPNARVRANAIALPKSNRPAVDQSAPDPVRDFIDDLSIHPAGRPLLGWCVEAMIRHGHFSGVECGFMSYFAALALSAGGSDRRA